MSRRALTEAELADVLASHPAWRLQSGHLVREASVAFPVASAWLVKHAPEFERRQHHPVATLSYEFLRVEVYTHDRATLTTWDRELMEFIDDHWLVEPPTLHSGDGP